MEDKYKTVVIPYSLPEMNTERKECEIGIQKMSVTFVQEDDTNHRTDNNPDQYLTIETEDTCATREEALQGQGYYYVIKTDRWAIESADDLKLLVDTFEDMLYATIRKKKEEEDDAVREDTPQGY